MRVGTSDSYCLDHLVTCVVDNRGGGVLHQIFFGELKRDEEMNPIGSKVLEKLGKHIY